MLLDLFLLLYTCTPAGYFASIFIIVFSSVYHKSTEIYFYMKYNQVLKLTNQNHHNMLVKPLKEQLHLIDENVCNGRKTYIFETIIRKIVFVFV